MPTVVRQKEITKTRQLEDGTLEEERTPVFVYVSCYNQACARYHNLQSNLDFEEKVPGIREETAFTYADRGGDMPGIENTHVRWAPQDIKYLKCEECGHPTTVSGTKSVKIQAYGVGPGTGLKGAERAAALAASKVQAENASSNAEIAALKSQMEQQNKMIELLLKQDKSSTKKTTKEEE